MLLSSLLYLVLQLFAAGCFEARLGGSGLFLL